MVDSWDYNLSVKDLDILIEECGNEIDNSNRELSLLIVRRKILQNKIKEWQMEKDWLILLKNGENVEKLIDITPQQTVKTVNRRYTELRGRFRNIQPTNVRDMNFEDPEDTRKSRVAEKRTPSRTSVHRDPSHKNPLSQSQNLDRKKVLPRK